MANSASENPARVIELIIKADVSEEKATNIFTNALSLLTPEERQIVKKALVLKSKKGVYINFVV